MPNGRVISADAFFGDASAEAATPKSKLAPGTVIPADHFFNATPQAPLAKKADSSGFLDVPKSAWNAWNDHIDRWLGHTKEQVEKSFGMFEKAGKDFDASKETGLPFAGMKSVGEGILAVGQLLWAPAGAAVQSDITDPITRISKSLPAADDLHPIDTKTHTWQRGGKGFTVNREDVDQTTRATNDFIETIAPFFVGGGARPVADPGMFDLLTPEAKVAFKARVTAVPKKLETAFDTFAVQSPEGARAFADSVNKVDPVLAKTLHKRIQKYIDASETELGVIGRAAAKANIEELEGRIPKDYSKFKVVLPSRPTPKGELPEPTPSGTSPTVDEATRNAAMLGRMASEKDYPKFKIVPPSIPTPMPPPPGMSATVSDAMKHSAMLARLTHEQAGAGIRRTVQEAHEALDAEFLPEIKEAGEAGAAHAFDGADSIRSRGEGIWTNPTSNFQYIFERQPDGSYHVRVAYGHEGGALTSLVPAEDLEHFIMKHEKLGAKDATKPVKAEAPKIKEVKMPLPTKRSTVPVKDVAPLQARLNKQLAEGSITREEWDSRMKTVSRLKATGEPLAAKAANEPVIGKRLTSAELKAKLLARVPEGAKGGEGAASQEAINALAEQKAKGETVYRLDEDGQHTPMPGLEGRDFKSIKGQPVIKMTSRGPVILDRGGLSKAEVGGLVQRAIGYGLGSEDITQLHAGVPLTRANVAKLFDFARKVPGVSVAEGKLAEYWDQILRTFNPEALGTKGEGKLGGSIIAKNQVNMLMKDTWEINRAKGRLSFWDKNPKLAATFIKGFERGVGFTDARLQAASTAYRDWNQRIFLQDRRNGIVYDPRDHYLSHIFENPKEVETWLTETYGSSWTRPGFAKDRGFDLYEQAVRKGFKPRFTNPEDIMLARQHASNVAEAKVQTLRELEQHGLAVRKPKVVPPDWIRPGIRPSPDGSSYWVHNSAEAILHNLYDTTSLWEMKNFGGDLYRGGMALKNKLIPIKLALSAFHPLHVATIDNATAMVRADAELLSGAISGPKWLARRVGSLVPTFGIGSPGYRLLRAAQGLIPDSELTAADQQALHYMREGGFTPQISAQYRLNSIDNARRAWDQGSAKAIWHLPWALYEKVLQKPIFEVWIPSLKAASYLKDAQSALKINPELATNAAERLKAFRRIAKSVDNRYGEMQYGTLFWNRTAKDIAVFDTLSLGWNLGFVREYGGGMLDIGQAATTAGGLAAKAKSGLLNRPLFIANYTTQALMYGGLMTYWMSGKIPEKWEDYVYPRTGETDEQGKETRVSTMFYTREFGSLYKRSQAEGPIAGVSDLVQAKGSGMISLAGEGAKAVMGFTDQMKDPNSRWYTLLEQHLHNALEEIEPISVTAAGKETTTGAKVRAFAGLSKAPKYVTDTPTEARISALYRKEYFHEDPAFDRAQQSKAGRELKQMIRSGDTDKAADKIAEIREQFPDLTAKKLRQMTSDARKGIDPHLRMFEKFSPAEQRIQLDRMTPEERQLYLRHADRAVRYNYVAPEDRSEATNP